MQVLQLDPAVPDVLISLTRILAKAPSDEARQSWRDLSRKRVPFRLTLEHANERLRRRRTLERLATGEHLEEHTSERPHIRAPVDGGAGRLLGAHVSRSTDDDSGARRRGGRG